MTNSRLDKYEVYVKLTVLGESPEDALDYANTAIDSSDLLDQDGIVGIELVDDAESLTLAEDRDDDDFGGSDIDY